MIALKSVSVAIGKVGLLHDLDLEVPTGKLIAVVGANGAGKTTLLRTISRLMPVARGDITYDGHRINDASPESLARAGLIHVPQGRQIIPTLSVEENLRLGAQHLPGQEAATLAANLDREYRRFPILRERRHVPGGALSGGEQQMLAVSRGLMMNPKLLMLDEPSLGLAPKIVQAIMAELRALRDAGVTIMLVEQAAMVALKIADFAYVVRNGRVVLSGRSSDLLKDPKLVQSYLG